MQLNMYVIVEFYGERLNLNGGSVFFIEDTLHSRAGLKCKRRRKYSRNAFEIVPSPKSRKIIEVPDR